MAMTELTITTTDENFARDLKAANIPGLKISVQHFRMDDTELSFLPVVIMIGTVIGTAAGTIALNLFSNWLYDRIKKDSTHVTTINEQNITNNIGQINIIINNYVKDYQKPKDE